MGNVLDALQGALDIAGLAPGVGEPADFVNAVVSVKRRRYDDAALSVTAMIPIAGIAGTGTKISNKARKAAPKPPSKPNAGKSSDAGGKGGDSGGGKKSDDNKPCGCKPCIPPVGTIGHRHDNGHSHYPWSDPHTHYYKMNQIPKNCDCFWSKIGGEDGIAVMPGSVPMKPARGGGKL